MYQLDPHVQYCVEWALGFIIDNLRDLTISFNSREKLRSALVAPFTIYIIKNKHSVEDAQTLFVQELIAEGEEGFQELRMFLKDQAQVDEAIALSLLPHALSPGHPAAAARTPSPVPPAPAARVPSLVSPVAAARAPLPGHPAAAARASLPAPPVAAARALSQVSSSGVNAFMESLAKERIALREYLDERMPTKGFRRPLSKPRWIEEPLPLPLVPVLPPLPQQPDPLKDIIFTSPRGTQLNVKSAFHMEMPVNMGESPLVLGYQAATGNKQILQSSLGAHIGTKITELSNIILQGSQGFERSTNPVIPEKVKPEDEPKIIAAITQAIAYDFIEETLLLSSSSRESFRSLVSTIDFNTVIVVLSQEFAELQALSTWPPDAIDTEREQLRGKLWAKFPVDAPFAPETPQFRTLLAAYLKTYIMKKITVSTFEPRLAGLLSAFAAREKKLLYGWIVPGQHIQPINLCYETNKEVQKKLTGLSFLVEQYIILRDKNFYIAEV